MVPCSGVVDVSGGIRCWVGLWESHWRAVSRRLAIIPRIRGSARHLIGGRFAQWHVHTHCAFHPRSLLSFRLMLLSRDDSPVPASHPPPSGTLRRMLHTVGECSALFLPLPLSISLRWIACRISLDNLFAVVCCCGLRAVAMMSVHPSQHAAWRVEGDLWPSRQTASKRMHCTHREGGDVDGVDPRRAGRPASSAKGSLGLAK
jgi:hypothetical protein